MDNTFKLTLDEFLTNTACDDPTPGGGSVAAVTAALAAALIQMVGNLTVGKACYREVEPEVEQLIAKGSALTEQLKALAADDMTHFGSFMEVLRMPKDTPEQSAERSDAMQQALIAATKTPLSIATAGTEVLAIAARLAKICNKAAISDAGAVATIAAGAIQAALIIAAGNLTSIKDQEFLTWAKGEIASLTDKTNDLKAATLAQLG